jgi:hypothetical protein
LVASKKSSSPHTSPGALLDDLLEEAPEDP